MNLLKSRARNMQVVYVEAIPGIKNEGEGIVRQVWKKGQHKVEFFRTSLQEACRILQIIISLNFQAAFALRLNGLL